MKRQSKVFTGKSGEVHLLTVLQGLLFTSYPATAPYCQLSLPVEGG